MLHSVAQRFNAFIMQDDGYSPVFTAMPMGVRTKWSIGFRTAVRPGEFPREETRFDCRNKSVSRGFLSWPSAIRAGARLQRRAERKEKRSCKNEEGIEYPRFPVKDRLADSGEAARNSGLRQPDD